MHHPLSPDYLPQYPLLFLEYVPKPRLLRAVAMADSDFDGGDPYQDYPPAFEREVFPIGRIQQTGILCGTCIGDDMTIKGTNTTRVGARQSNGAGGTMDALVESWAEAIIHLAFDIFVIGETRIA